MTWTQKTRIGLHAKIAQEVWEEADEETKEAVHTKRAGIIADKQKQSSTATHGAEEFHKLVLVSSTFQLSTSSTTHHGHSSPVQLHVHDIFFLSSKKWLKKRAGPSQY
jgi:hypothetical protein